MSEVMTNLCPEFFLPEIHISCEEGPLENHFHRTFRSFIEVNDFLNHSGNIKAHRLYKILYTVDVTGQYYIHGSMVLTHVSSKLYDHGSMSVLEHCKRQASIELDKLSKDDARYELLVHTIAALEKQRLEIPIYDPASL